MLYLEVGVGELDGVEGLDVPAAGAAGQVSIQLQTKVS
jgi:hypothetical protein